MAVRLGFIGTGGMAGAHMKNLQTFDDVEFVAMCDIVADKVEERTKEYGGTPYTDFQKMFDKEELDAVYICTPPFAHGDQERIACEKGIPMFIEKPIAVRLEQAWRRESLEPFDHLFPGTPELIELEPRDDVVDATERLVAAGP